jgi:hypothetical protein
MVKPQLIVADFGGAHNANLEQSHARLMTDGSWKQQRIVVMLPTADLIPAEVALTHWSLAFPPNNGVARILAKGMEVGDAYSSAVEQVLAHPAFKDWEYILTIEHDNGPPPDGVLRLLKRMDAHPEYAAISGLYFTKGPGGCAQIWGDKNDPVWNCRPQLPDLAGGLKDCWGIGMGFALFRISMFKDARLRRPWFVTQKEGGVSTQDLYFWSDAAKYGYRCAVDCGVKVGHFDYEGKFGPPEYWW